MTEDSDSAQAEAGPFSIYVKGKQASFALIVALAGCAFVWLFWALHQQDMDEHAKHRSDHNRLERAVMDMKAEVVYVLTLPEPERAKLHLQEPDSLRERRRRRGKDDE